MHGFAVNLGKVQHQQTIGPLRFAIRRKRGEKNMPFTIHMDDARIGEGQTLSAAKEEMYEYAALELDRRIFQMLDAIQGLRNAKTSIEKLF